MASKYTIKFLEYTSIHLLVSVISKFPFLLMFLLGLNVLDYWTGMLKAKRSNKINSKSSHKGFKKKIWIWVLVVMGFSVSITLVEFLKYFNYDKQTNFCFSIGVFVLIHCVINELRSVLENLVELGYSNYIPSWLVKGLEVTQKNINSSMNKIVDKVNVDSIQDNNTTSD